MCKRVVAHRARERASVRCGPPVLWSDLTQLGGGGSADLYQDTVDYLHTTAFTVLVHSPPVAQKMGSSTEKKSVLLPQSTGQ